MKRICVFCGSSPGKRKDYTKAAEQLGNTLLQKGIGLVYGGGDVGLMGKLAHIVFEGGGEVIGVIPKALAEKEVAYTKLSDLRIVDSMHERKALMAELSDAFVALPGGLGTVEEFFEILTWTQLGIHNKPCGILNICGYYDNILKFLDLAVDENFINRKHKSMLMIDKNPESLIEQFRNYTPPVIDKAKWVLELKNS